MKDEENVRNGKGLGLIMGWRVRFWVLNLLGACDTLTNKVKGHEVQWHCLLYFIRRARVQIPSSPLL